MNFGVESENQEFKLSTKEIAKAIESLGAMLNKCGKGKVYFGVRDDGEAVGIDVGKGTLSSIRKRIRDLLLPPVDPRIEIIDIDANLVIEITVEGSEKPYMANGLYLIRSRNQNLPLFPDELQKFYIDVTPPINEMTSPNQNPSFAGFRSLLVSHNRFIHEENYAQNWGFLTSKGEWNLLSYLFSDNNDVVLKVNRFAGTGRDEFLSHDEFGHKCLFLAMEEALSKASTFNQTNVDLSGNTRQETPRFQFEAVKEAWYNAVIHNRWARMIPPSIDIFSDRMEITSTGGLIRGLSEYGFFHGVSQPVNPGIAKFAITLNYMENAGHGVSKMVKLYSEDVFHLDDNFVRVTIPFAFPLFGVGPEANLDTKEKTLLELIAVRPSLSIAELSMSLGYSSATVARLLNSLKEKGLIERVGSKKSGYWQVKRP